MDVLSERPRAKSFQELLMTFGSADFLIKQSILPVVALCDGESVIRCIGTGFFISCTGYIATACHVLLDPYDRGYGRAIRGGEELKFNEKVKMGVVMPINPVSGMGAYHFLPFEFGRFWGEWKESPLLNRPDEFKMHTDVAICKVAPLSDGAPYQPLNLSSKIFRLGEAAYAIGYAEMSDIDFERRDGAIVLKPFQQQLFVSIGDVIETYPNNLTEPQVPAPGPCFGFSARVPGKMSGGPILGAEGAVVRGLVSRSFSGEKHAFGSMVTPAMKLPIIDETLEQMMLRGNEGIPHVQGSGL